VEVSNSVQRILVAVVAIPAAVGVVYWGGLPLAAVVGLLAALGAWELVGLARRQGVAPLGPLAVGVSAIFPLSVWALFGGAFPPSGADLLSFAASRPSSWDLLALLVLLVLAATLAARTPSQRPLAAAAVTLLVPLYCGALPSFLLGIRYGVGPPRHWPATWVVFFPLAVTWICDTAAMYGGKLMRGPKLAPVVSPGKTRSGAVAGLLGGVAAAVAYNRLALLPSGFTIPWWQAAAAGLLLSAVAQIGDLAESLLKREAGVKDSSHLIPGHGGVLDRLDSLYFVIPVAALVFRMVGVL
jgi:phosphatidate cytidylyltransferase